MRAFITTVAGMATRFTADLDRPLPKCIYYPDKPEHTILHRLLTFAESFDRIVVVGGFMFDEVKAYADGYIPDAIKSKLTFVLNPFYADFGSGYSLYLGLKMLKESGASFSEIVFAEGDLFFDRASFEQVTQPGKDVITVSRNFVTADRSVALYTDLQGVPHYIYDTAHGALEIKGAFSAVYNSAQIWQFADAETLFAEMEKLGEEGNRSTNLVLINSYLTERSKTVLPEMVCMEKWINCNTINDLAKADFEED